MLSPVLRSIFNERQKKRLFGISDGRTKQMVSLEAGQQPGLTQPKKIREKKEGQVRKRELKTFTTDIFTFLLSAKTH